MTPMFTLTNAVLGSDAPHPTRVAQTLFNMMAEIGYPDEDKALADAAIAMGLGCLYIYHMVAVELEAVGAPLPPMYESVLKSIVRDAASVFHAIAIEKGAV